MIRPIKLIQSTRTLGIFQIESPGQRELVGKLKPGSFNDLIIDISLFRPGPVKSDMIAPFLNSRHGFTAADVIHPDLAPILQETEGVVVFHEQVISIIATMTGISLAAADEKRRSLGDKAGQQEVCDWFFPAATQKGYALVVSYQGLGDLARLCILWILQGTCCSFRAAYLSIGMAEDSLPGRIYRRCSHP